MTTRRVAFGGILAVGMVLLIGGATAATVVCHHPGPLEDPFDRNERTITVTSQGMLAAHLRHGDTLGPCVTPTPRPTSRPTPRPTSTARPTPRPTVRPTAGPTTEPTATPSATATLGPQPTAPRTDR